MNRRAFLLGEETIRIIIAAICILFLAFLLYSIYENNKTSRDLENAKADLERIESTISELSSSSESVRSVVIENPKGWFLSSWNSKGDFPQKCKINEWDNCLCICKMHFKASANIFGVSDCDKDSQCIEADYGVKGIYKTLFFFGIFYRIKTYAWGMGKEQETNLIEINSVPMEIYIQKIGKKITEKTTLTS
jgi:hypothetical protein